MDMKALITGASSGIGRDMARELARRGYDLILTARRQDRLEALKGELNAAVRILPFDLSKKEDCLALYEAVRDEDIEILVNNAGLGVYGSFDETDLDRELSMLSVNITAPHILTKLFLRDFMAKNRGYILNVSSVAAFQPGPLLAGYYASKAYVQNLTEAVYEELRRAHSAVSVSTLCPGPVRTEFDTTAGVHFSMEGLTSGFVARYARKHMFLRRLVIIPGLPLRAVRLFGRFVPRKLLLRMVYRIQRRKHA